MVAEMSSPRGVRLLVDAVRAAPWEDIRVTDGSGLDAEVAWLRAEYAEDVATFGSSGLTVTVVEQSLVDELRI
ncbi:hypothetical protein [Streptomyces sp. URMC 129]|uniref:hypothetical protein n=1 Tax=Streptomyces sp. URMC 129 TaxID=3423407 RepID=UPI003F19FBE4